ncbi:RNA-binding protein 44 isoform X2 [Cebidichthys violaceus]|uniref:RNA-binding protein 44 isoform X2 n=1 Tax=Cebidichthys violaceus TaxID=271503 RepID=UPI0035CAE822
MAVFHTVWPGWPPYTYVASEYAHVGVPLHCVMPCFYNMVAGKPGPKAIRRFYLERSVFDLVDYHKFLSLTDPKLLGWYLCLSQEDRTIIQDEGGFQHFLLRHPALELSRHHVYVKCHVSSVSPAQPTVMFNRPTHVSQWSGATKCGSDLERLPNNVRETLNQLGCSCSCSCSSSSSSSSGVDGSQKRPTAFNGFGPLEPHQQNVCTPGASSHLNEQRPSWPTSSKDSSSLTSFSLDVDLERHRRSELRSQAAMTRGQSPDCSWAEVSLIQSDWPTVERGSSPEYYSFDSIQTDGVEHSDGSVLQPAELEPAKSTPDPVEENSPEEGLRDHAVCGNERTDGEDEAGVSFGDQSDNFHSIMENDGSILACLTSDYVKGLSSGVHSGPVHTDGEALSADGETSKSDRSVAKVTAAGTCSSLMPRVTAALPPRSSAATQTEHPGTADERVNTEVRMVDLDYLAEEFIKLRTTREKLRRQNEEMKSSGGTLRKECDCVQRAQRAELSLLALQHSVCRQYCWRLYYTSSEGVTPKNPSANITGVLQQLECEYSRMRDEILAGVPLEQLKPLSVDCETIATRATCIPAKIISDVLGSVPSRVRLHTETSKKSKTTTAERQELNACEAWYDAEENLQHAGPAAARTGQEPAGTGQEPAGTGSDEADESTSEEAKSSVLCVSNLPGNVTESDVMLWFEKYHASEVSISALKNDSRVAIVTVSGPRAAEAAVRELRGCSMQGHALQVEHINGASGGSQRPDSASIRGPESAEDPTGPPTSNTERKPIGQPPLGSSTKTRKVVFISPTPTAKGTCVPRQYGTMGSFDTLMAELSQRHPSVCRQRIVDALMELQVKHRGVLSGLPLRTIREMTSELLTWPGTAGTATP